MAIVRFTGNAQSVAQVDTLTVGGTIEADDLFILAINGKTLTIPAGDTNAATVAANIAAAWNACAIAEFREIVATPDDVTVLLQAKTAGRPFVVTASTTEVGGGSADSQSFSRTTTTASAGPNDWGQPANWSTGSVPADGDEVHLENSAIDLLYGLDQHTIALDSLHVSASFTGAIGLADYNGQYHEYRDRALRIGATRVVIGAGPGAGSSRIRLDTGSDATVITVLGTGVSSDPALPALQWKGTHASNMLEVLKGSVGVALAAGEAAQVALSVGYLNNVTSDADVRVGAGVTLVDLHQTGGKVDIRSDVDAIEKTDGTLTVSAGAVDSLRNFGGAVFYNSTGALGATTLGGRGRLDFSQDLAAKTVGLCELSAGAVLFDPFGVAMPAFKTIDCTLADVKVIVGFDKTYTPS